MQQLKIILQRLKSPSVIISITSQIVLILTTINVKVDVDAITAIVMAVCSIFVLLGIVSDPNSQQKGYGDDIFKCTQCNKDTQHVLVNGKMICKECGNEYIKQ